MDFFSFHPFKITWEKPLVDSHLQQNHCWGMIRGGHAAILHLIMSELNKKLKSSTTNPPGRVFFCNHVYDPSVVGWLVCLLLGILSPGKVANAEYGWKQKRRSRWIGHDLVFNMGMGYHLI